MGAARELAGLGFVGFLGEGFLFEERCRQFPTRKERPCRLYVPFQVAWGLIVRAAGVVLLLCPSQEIFSSCHNICLNPKP